MRPLDYQLQQLTDRSLLVSVDSSSTARRIASHLGTDPMWTEIVPGLDSLAVAFNPLQSPPALARSRLEQQLEHVPAVLQDEATHEIEIPIRYGGDAGPDLSLLAEKNGMTTDEVIHLHSAAVHTVELLGFLPGFAYLSGLPSALIADRLDTPRLRVPAGSVGVANGRSGIYSLTGAGGWPLIGHTDLPLLRQDDEAPFVLSPGQKVRFLPK